jgi:hypothetical protein
MWYGGIDWADEHHDTVVLDEQGQRVGSCRVTHTPEGLAQLVTFLQGTVVSAPEPLGHLVRGELFATIVSALDDPCVDVRCQVLYALAEGAGPAAVDLLLARTTDPDTCIRHAAVHALARVGDKSLVPLLERIEQYDQGRCRAVWVKDAARYAIECISKRHLIQPT